MSRPLQTDPQYKLRLPTALKDSLETAARQSGRSMNAEIIQRLEASFGESVLSGSDLSEVVKAAVKEALREQQPAPCQSTRASELSSGIPERVKAVRVKMRMNQVEFAKAIGATQGSVSKWEMGREQPRLEALAQMAKLANVSLDYLAGH